MKPFQVAVHARPTGIEQGEDVQINARALPTLDVPADRQAALLDVTFEDAFEQLEALPNLYIELDGSLVWVSGPEVAAGWQLDGHLWDRDGRLFALDVKGVCPEPVFDQLLSAIGWPRTAVMCRLIEHAVFLEEATFRSYAFLR